MKLIKVIHHLFWNKDDSFRSEAEMFRKIACTGTSRNIIFTSLIVVQLLALLRD